MHAAHRSRQPQQIMFTEATTRLQMSRNSQREKKRSLCVCLWASVWEKRTENLCSVASFTKQMKIGNQFGENTSLIPIFSYNLLPQLHISKKKKTFLPLTKIAITRTGNILLCTKARMVSLHSLCSAFADTIFPFAIQKALVQQRVGGNNLKKIKCQTIWGKTLTTCQHYFQAVFPFFPVL